jgi:hypothetical protein
LRRTRKYHYRYNVNAAAYLDLPDDNLANHHYSNDNTNYHSTDNDNHHSTNYDDDDYHYYNYHNTANNE